MSPALIEAIPNVSEGRDAARLDRFAAAIARRRRDAARSHRRLVASSRRLHLRRRRRAHRAAAVALAAAAMAEIDLAAHAGVHPRIGALDVLPFVPLGSASMDDAVAIAHAVGREIGETLGVPSSSTRPRRARRTAEPRGDPARRARRPRGAAARAGVAAGLRPCTLHPTAGAIAVGARGPLVAWNLVLDRPDLRAGAPHRAHHPHVERRPPLPQGARPPLAHTGQVQVSMDLTDYRTTSMADVSVPCDAEARPPAPAIADSEIIGLVPRAALDRSRERWRRRSPNDTAGGPRRSPRSRRPDRGRAHGDRSGAARCRAASSPAACWRWGSAR